MGALIALLGPLLPAILGHGFDDMLKAYQSYNSKEISEAELKEKLNAIMYNSMVQIIQSSNDAAVKTFDSFQQTLRQSRIVQWVWAYFVCGQITFILWLELGVPGLYTYGYMQKGWPVGSLDQWAMAAVLACLGIGAIKYSQPKTLPILPPPQK